MRFCYVAIMCLVTHLVWSQEDLTVSLVQTPSLDTETTAFIGDVLFESYSGHQTRCLVPKFGHKQKRNFGVATVIIKQNVPMCELFDEGEYHPPYINWVTNRDGSGKILPIALKRKKKGIVDFRMLDVVGSVSLTKVNESSFTIEEKVTPIAGDPIKKIELGGLYNDRIEFIYVEESVSEGGVSSTTRPFTFDLKSGKTVFWRGMELEVINLGRGELTYKIINDFR